MNKPLKPIPKFASEAEERAFWETPDNDSTAYLDWSKAKRAVFPNLKPSTQAISLRLPVSLLSAIKVRANRMDVPYQSLIKPGWPRRQRKQISAQPKPYRVNPAPGKPPKLSTPYSPKRHLQLDRRLPHRSWCGSAVGRSFSSKYAFPVEPHARQIDGGGQLKLQINGILCRLPVDTPDFIGKVLVRIGLWVAFWEIDR